jgi:hypothetical protein
MKNMTPFPTIFVGRPQRRRVDPEEVPPGAVMDVKNSSRAAAGIKIISMKCFEGPRERKKF